MAERTLRNCAHWRRGLVGVVFALLAIVFMPRAATALPNAQPLAEPTDLLPVPGAFRISASNGYALYVFAEPPRAGRSASISVQVVAKGRGAIYFAPATVTETSMQADLGTLGEISVSFHRTNQPNIFHCGKRTLRFDSGQYEGTIDFHGEEGYTNVEETTGPGSGGYTPVEYCAEIIGGGASFGAPRGAELFVRNPGLGPELSVRNSRPGAAAEISASTSEYSNGISIRRFATRRIPGNDFRYDRRLRTASLRPPAPFAGSARFDLGKKAGRRWSGDLTVDLPGSTGVPLTGPTLRATLIPSR